MSEMDQAAERLERAVAKLEAAARRNSDRKSAAKAGGPASDTTAIVAERLDEAILRLDRLLEE
jgi:hypothetical protein